MMNDDIRLGQWWMARLTKRDLCVRLESYNPDGGWFARVLSHGRLVRIKNAKQLLERCDKAVVVPNPLHRSLAVLPSQKESTPKKPLPQAEKEIVREAFVFLPLLDATAVVLRESDVALSTREIIALVVERQLWKSTGATPWGTLNAAMNRDIQTIGTLSRFKKTERGKFTLQ